MLDFIAFCAATIAENDDSVVETPQGSICAGEKYVRAFLAYLRFGGGAPTDDIVLKSKTLENKFCMLKKGLRECELAPDALPDWARAGARSSNAMDSV